METKQLTRDMVAAIKVVLQGHWDLAHPYAEAEARKLAETGKLIALGIADKSINREQAKILLRMQANATQAVFTAIEGIGMIAAQDAINAALGVVRGAVNAFIGFDLF